MILHGEHNFVIDFIQAFHSGKLGDHLADKVRREEKAVIHCRAGIGRSSILAGAIMIKLGVESQQIFETISKHRAMQVPDTEEQREWLLQLADKM